MPRKPQTKTVNGDNRERAAMPRFVRCELSDSDKQVVRDNLLSAEKAFVLLEEMGIAGIKVSLSYEKQNDCFACYATGSSTSVQKYAGLCLSARGPSAIGAFTALQYKHESLLAGDWSSAEGFSSGEKWG